MNSLDNKLANAQICLTAALLALIALVVVWLEIRGVPHLDADQLKEFTTWSGWLRNIGMIVIGSFWFNRNRSGGIPEAPTVTQTQTAPDGTVTSIKSPAHLPLPSLPTPAPAKQ